MSRKIVKITLTGIISIFALLVILFFAITFPAVQQWIKEVALKELTAKIDSRVSIENIRIRFPNSLNASAIYVEGQSGDTLLFVENLNAKFQLMPLLKKKVQINEINLSGFQANILRDSLNTPLNFQFIIDAFASKDTTEKEPSNLKINLENIRLKNGKINYHVKSEPHTPEIFNANHIEITNFTSDISLNYSNVEDFKLNINKFSFLEKSGFELKNINLNVIGKKKGFSVPDFQLLLANSSIEADAEINYQGIELEELADKGTISLNIKKSSVLLSDVKALSPTLSDFNDSIHIQGEITGKLPAINVNKLSLSMGEFLFDANASITDYTDTKKAYIQAYINKLKVNEKSISQLSRNTGKDIALPEEVKQLGNITLNGSISGKLEQLLLSLHLSSNPGSISLNGTVGYIPENERINYNVRYQTQHFQLNRLLQNDVYGGLSMRGFLSGHYANEIVNADAKIFLSEFQYDKMNINNTEIHAIIKNNMYDVILNMDNELGYISLNASATMDKSLALKMNASARRFALSNFIELENFPNSRLNLSMKTDITGNNPDDIVGRMLLDSISIQSDKQNFSTSALGLKAGFDEDKTRFFTLNHKLIKASAKGKITLSALQPQLTNVLNTYFPALDVSKKKTKLITNQNDFTLFVTCGNTESLSKTFDLPYTITKNTHFTFSYNDTENRIRTQIDCPESKIGETMLRNLKFDISNETGPIRLTVSGEIPDSTKIRLNGIAENNQVILNTTLDNLCDTFRIKGNFNNQVVLERNSTSEPLKTTLSFEESNLLYNTFALNINPATIVMQDEKIHINNLRINHDGHPDEFISANGIYSFNKQDTLRIQLNNLEISELTEAENKGHYGLSGLINGNIVVVGTQSTPNIYANPLNITNITLNKHEIGNLNIRSAWSDERNIILVSGALERTDGAENSTIRGRIQTAKDSVSVRVNLNEIKLAWLEPFLKGTLHNIDGNLNTDLTISGKTNAPQVNGLAYIENGKFGVDFTNVTYTINDSIFINPNKIDIRNLGIIDNNGNSTKLNCVINHKNFNHLSYDFSARMRDFLVLNTMSQKDSLFYGLVRLSGSIDGKGDDHGITVNMRIQDSNNSKFAVILPGNLTAQEHQRIVFVDHRTEEEKQAEEDEKNAFSFPANLKIGLAISPKMEFTVFLDPSQKSRAIVTGTGDIDFSYNTGNSTMDLYGDYEIEKGNFTFVLQNVIQRQFQILNGSVVKFNGNPMKSSFDIKAQYALKADLATLDQSFASDPNLQASTRVDVNCILTIKGNLDKLEMKYDIQLPNVQTDVEQNVRTFINSEEILIKEFAYLLAIGSFYSPDFATAAKTNNSAISSFTSATLSSQLNNLIAGALGNNVSLSTNVNLNDNNDVNMDLTLSTRWFNDRLTINTNVEYNNANTTSTADNTTFGFGDFDAELKLNRTGTLRLKAYNKTNEQYYQKAPLTQGVGIVYTKETARFKQLFQPTRKRNRREQK